MLGNLNPLLFAASAFASVFLAAIAGAAVAGRLPSHHLEKGSADAIKLIMGLIATLSAMVLGFLTAQAQSIRSAETKQLLEIAASITEIDRLLTYYGPEASGARRELRETVARMIGTMEGSGAWRTRSTVGSFFASVANLKPRTEAQSFIQREAFTVAASLRHSRALMEREGSNSISSAFLGVLLFWLVALFFGFALFVRLNATIVVAFLTGALSIACALFLILELDHPNRGFMALSSAPLRSALAEMILSP
ncbi:hypothetical protein MAMC_00033 [Methylacidimicrobium cyclopophantes]|uniref:DUF4239 domain-containing protein n=1 Tax=Methylacidimicrobium cyclopophantes TaxID=1041766 RepID=A0A5E6MFR1_9BACT|nr:hypothetical protein [Methylacidimicrobium cyclopophantes]VVM04370.1 hypothetical protein MAMC_00033 [Methylacidimicrobium cyclopophantes]